MSTVLYDSRRNTMKRHEISGTDYMSAPSVSAYSGYLYTSTIAIPHNLGYIPQFRYYYEPFGDGIIWPPLVSRLGQFANNPTDLSQKGPGIIAWPDSTYLYIQLFYEDNSLTDTFPVYWVIYRDLSLA